MLLLTLMYLINTTSAFAEPAFRPNPFSSSVSDTIIHDVDVGRDGRLFEPRTLHADIGDIINFHFYPFNHSIAESSFEKPCQPKDTSEDGCPIFSGFVATKHWVAPHMFSLKLNVSNPIWLYSSHETNNDCNAGQVMVINPPTSLEDTIEEYTKAAALTNDAKSPVHICGGNLVEDDRYNETLANLTSQTDNATSTKTSVASWIMSGALWTNIAHAVVLGGLILIAV